MVPKYQEMIEDQKEFMLHHKNFMRIIFNGTF